MEEKGAKNPPSLNQVPKKLKFPSLKQPTFKSVNPKKLIGKEIIS